MKFTLSWLKDHLDTEASVDEIAQTLTDLGLEVESIQNPAQSLESFRIGKVLSAEQHPDADRLRICQVETHDGTQQIICGAPNARAGITVVVARPGDYVPGIDTTIGVGKIRGVESFGMMASERELELSEEHDGIIELPSGEVGERFIDWLGKNDPSKVDPVIEIAITPNRPDALGVRGIARDLSARGLGQMKPLADPGIEGVFPCPISVSIDDDTIEQAPVFYGRLIRGVKNAPSPAWLQDRLRAIGLRPISLLVDVTNFFTYDLNRPLHVFDADKISAGTLRVHRAKGGETLIGLDEKEYHFDEGMTVISDGEGPESIAGVMGGLRTGCTLETQNVFVEAAYFDPVRTAYTGRALKINSDARYRFERGIDPNFTQQGLEMACQMIADHLGGEISSRVEAGSVPDVARSYMLEPKRVESLVGMSIAEAEQRRILTSLGFRMEGNLAHVPSWRPDVQGSADLVEEIARVTSLTKLEGKPLPKPSAGVTAPVMSLPQRRAQMGRRMAAALGYNECVSYSFIDAPAAELFGGGTIDTEIENPISSEMSHMRPSLLPGLLRAAARNQARGSNNLALFEVGPIFNGAESGQEKQCIAGILVGETSPKDTHQSMRAVDVFDAKADVEEMLSALGAPEKIQVLRGGDSWWHPGQHGRICLGPKKELATFGTIHPKILDALDVKGPAVAFVIWPDEIPQPRKKSATRAALNISQLQPVERDFAFIVDTQVEALTLTNAAAGAEKDLIEDVRAFDVFVGGTLGEGKKSIAITARLQPKDKTLTDAQIEAVSQKIIEKVTKATGGVLRG